MSRKALSVFVCGVLLALSARLVAQGMSHEPALGGYCPVAYAAVGKALKGDARFASDYQGKRYLFVNADAKKMFDANPEKFAIGYEGWCATGIAHGQKIASDPTLFTVHNGITYLFSAKDAKSMFDRDKAGTVQKADTQWKGMMKK